MQEADPFRQRYRRWVECYRLDPGRAAAVWQAVAAKTAGPADRGPKEKEGESK